MPLTPTDPAKAQIWLRGEAPNQILDVYVPRGARGEIGPVGPQGPAVPTTMTVLETTTGPETPGATGPQGATGAKGDPGGWVTGTSLGTNDLNLITTDGIYRQNSPANATLAANYPMANVTGVLYVSQASTAAYMVQTFHSTSGTTTGARVVYERIASNSTWSPWRAYASTRVDQAAGRVIYQWDDANAREQIVYGDTGWRSIGLDATYGVVAAGDYFGAPNGGAVADTSVQIRRMGNTCWLVGTGLQPKQDYTSTSRNLIILPAGFRAGRDGQHTICRYGNNTGDAAQKLVSVTPGTSWSNPAALTVTPLLDTNWAGFNTGTTWPKTNGTLWLNVSWITEDAWPTTLPGTVSGPIPNA